MKMVENLRFGESSSEKIHLETKDEAEKIIAALIQEVVDRNRQSQTPSKELLKNLVTVVDGEVGIGKSYTLKKYVRENPGCRTLIFLERKRAVQGYADELGGLAIYSDNNKPPIEAQLGEALTGAERIVIMTHSALLDLLKDNRHLYVFECFDLVAIDETFTSLSIYDDDYDDYSEIIGSLSLCGAQHAEDVSKIIRSVIDKVLLSGKDQVEILSFTEKDRSVARSVIQELTESSGHILSNSKIESLIKFLNNVAHEHGKVFYIEKIGNKTHLLSACSFFPKNRSLIFFADGGSKEGSILAMKKYSPGVEVKSVMLRHVNWNTHTFHIERGASGKGAINNLGRRNMTRLVSSLSEIESSLILSHKDLADELRQEISLDRHDILHWANHKGTNQYSHHRRMYILSLYWQPPKVYSSKYLSEVDRGSYKPGEYESINLPVLNLTTEVKQAVGRINRNYEHDQVDIYLRIPDGELGDTLIEQLQREFSGATFVSETWY